MNGDKVVVRSDLVDYVSVPNRGYLLWMNQIGDMGDEMWHISFRPQQGLPIMNAVHASTLMLMIVSVPNRGYLLWIDVYLNDSYELELGFRPQQGLPIMNPWN